MVETPSLGGYHSTACERESYVGEQHEELCDIKRVQREEPTDSPQTTTLSWLYTTHVLGQTITRCGHWAYDSFALSFFFYFFFFSLFVFWFRPGTYIARIGTPLSERGVAIGRDGVEETADGSDKRKVGHDETGRANICSV